MRGRMNLGMRVKRRLKTISIKCIRENSCAPNEPIVATSNRTEMIDSFSPKEPMLCVRTALSE